MVKSSASEGDNIRTNALWIYGVAQVVASHAQAF